MKQQHQRKQNEQSSPVELYGKRARRSSASSDGKHIITELNGMDIDSDSESDNITCRKKRTCTPNASIEIKDENMLPKENISQQNQILRRSILTNINPDDKYPTARQLPRNNTTRAPPNIKWKTSSYIHMMKQILKEYSGRLTFSDIMHYMRTTYNIGENASLVVLHTLQLSNDRKLIFPYKDSLVSKDMFKSLHEPSDDEEGSSNDASSVTDDAIDATSHATRYSYRISKRNFAKS